MYTERKRINGVSKHFFETGRAKPEMRGGSRQTEQQLTVTESIVDFIKKLKVTESHYGRGKSQRQYLPSELNITKLWRMWKTERENNQLPIAQKQKFEKVFHDRFNLSFIPPKVDVCSQCETLKAKIELNINAEENTALLKLHETRAKQFYEILRKSADNDKALTVTFDMQQIQPLPKTNVGEAYYARQLGVYNFTVVIHTPRQIRSKNVHIYTWIESDTGKGSNQVVSALDHFFQKTVEPLIARRRYTTIDIFSDCCPAQNKNITMLGYLLRKMESPSVYKFVRDIQYYFPVRGHSFLPPDRVFGQIEKKLRKIPVIKTPASYQEIFEEHGKVYVYGDDWNVYDFKLLAQSCLKPTGPLNIQKNRKWVFSRRHFGAVEVNNNSYFEPGTLHPILKPTVTKFFLRKPKLILSMSSVSLKKRDDVLKLISLMSLTDSEKRFYETELNKPLCSKNDDDVRAKDENPKVLPKTPKTEGSPRKPRTRSSTKE